MITDEMIAKAAAEINQAILDSLPEEEECTHTFSDRFHKKMKKLLRHADHYVLHKVLMRAACILIAILLSVSIFLACNPQARAAVVDWIKERFADFHHYFFVGDEKPLDSPEKGPRSYSLGWLPDGYRLLDSFEFNNKSTFIYLSDDGQMMQFIYMFGSSTESIYTGRGEYEEKQVAVEGLSADVFSALKPGESNAIVWQQEDIIFTITAFLPEEDLIKMAQNVVEKEN